METSKNITFLTLCSSHASCKNYQKALRKTKSGNLKFGLDYLFQTYSMYKRKFTSPILQFQFLLFLSLPLIQNPNHKYPTKIGVFLLKRIAFQPLINIKWKVSSISLCMQVICTFFFPSALKQSGFRFPDYIVAIRKIKSENT